MYSIQYVAGTTFTLFFRGQVAVVCYRVVTAAAVDPPAINDASADHNGSDHG